MSVGVYHLYVCTPILSEVLSRTAAKLGEGIRLGKGKTKFECFGYAMPARGALPFFLVGMRRADFEK